MEETESTELGAALGIPWGENVGLEAIQRPDQVLRILPNGTIAGAGGAKSPRSAHTAKSTAAASSEKKTDKVERWVDMF